MFCIGYTWTLLGESIEELHQVTLGNVEFHEVVMNFLEEFLVVVFCEVVILYMLGHNYLLHRRSLHAVAKKLPRGLLVLHLRYCFCPTYFFSMCFPPYILYIYFGFWVYPKGSLVITLVIACSSVCPSVSL